uniref:DBIRD complex subunit ZNF326 n=1 Tax=Apteryx owenii TaxID=8824 RepID=A0A8B9NZ55_APTOW
MLRTSVCYSDITWTVIMDMEAMVAHDPWTLTLTNPMGWRVMEVEAEEVVVVVTGLDLMSLTTPGLLWVGEICTDLAMVIMNPNKAASEVVMVVDLTTPTGIALTLSEPAPVGSRGRGTPAYPESGFGSRNYDAFGGPSTGRGRGRGHMGDFGGMHRPGIVVDYHNKPSPAAVAARGIKRKMIPQPYNKPGGTFIKKPKLTKPILKLTQKKSPNMKTSFQESTIEDIEVDTSGAVVIYEDFTRDAYDLGYQTFGDAKGEVKSEEEEKRRIEARREKQRRRREKNSEKYGDGYRMAFTCSFCKFRTFEEKEIESHLESAAHQETLDHIQKQTKFDKVVMEFLHECMVNKFKKTAMRKQQTSNQTENAQAVEKDIMEGVTADDHMMKVETVHCSACSVYVPALHSSVQQHLKSPDHTKGKQGENPFEINDQAQEQQTEEDDKADEPVEGEEEEEEEEEEETEEQTDFTLDHTEDN